MSDTKFVLKGVPLVANPGYKKHEKQNEYSKKYDVVAAIIREMNASGIKEVGISHLGISLCDKQLVSVKIVMERDFYSSSMIMDGCYDVLAAITDDNKMVRAEDCIPLDKLDEILRMLI